MAGGGFAGGALASALLAVSAFGNAFFAWRAASAPLAASSGEGESCGALEECFKRVENGARFRLLLEVGLAVETVGLLLAGCCLLRARCCGLGCGRGRAARPQEVVASRPPLGYTPPTAARVVVAGPVVAAGGVAASSGAAGGAECFDISGGDTSTTYVPKRLRHKQPAP